MRTAEETPEPEKRRDTVLDRIALRVGPWMAGRLIVSLRHLMSWTSTGEEAVTRLHDEGRPYVHAFYHDQLLMMTYSYLGQSYGRRLAVLTSRHRDGEYVARTLARFGHRMVRGSTGRGGAGGLRQLVKSLRSGDDVAIAVDGPRGPRHRVQLGAVEVARLGEATIVPVAFAASRAKTLRSWDAFQVPLPLTRGVFVYGEPITVPAGSGRDVMEETRTVLQDRLDRLVARALDLATTRSAGPSRRRRARADASSRTAAQSGRDDR